MLTFDVIAPGCRWSRRLPAATQSQALFLSHAIRPTALPFSYVLCAVRSQCSWKNNNTFFSFSYIYINLICTCNYFRLYEPTIVFTEDFPQFFVEISYHIKGSLWSGNRENQQLNGRFGCDNLVPSLATSLRAPLPLLKWDYNTLKWSLVIQSESSKLFCFQELAESKLRTPFPNVTSLNLRLILSIWNKYHQQCETEMELTWHEGCNVMSLRGATMKRHL